MPSASLPAEFATIRRRPPGGGSRLALCQTAVLPDRSRPPAPAVPVPDRDFVAPLSRLHRKPADTPRLSQPESFASQAPGGLPPPHFSAASRLRLSPQSATATHRDA